MMKKPPDPSQPCLHSLITILNHQLRPSILINIEDSSSFSSSFARFTRFKYLFKLKNCLCRSECQSYEPEIGCWNKASRAMAEHLQQTVMAFYRVTSKSDGKNQPFRCKDEDVKILELPEPDFLLSEDNWLTTSTNYSFEVHNSISDFLNKKQIQPILLGRALISDISIHGRSTRTRIALLSKVRKCHCQILIQQLQARPIHRWILHDQFPITVGLLRLSLVQQQPSTAQTWFPLPVLHVGCRQINPTLLSHLLQVTCLPLPRPVSLSHLKGWPNQMTANPQPWQNLHMLDLSGLANLPYTFVAMFVPRLHTPPRLRSMIALQNLSIFHKLYMTYNGERTWLTKLPH